jgi:hypothetical protein
MLPSLFARGQTPAAADREAEIQKLHEKIGQLTVENDFLARAFRR